MEISLGFVSEQAKAVVQHLSATFFPEQKFTKTSLLLILGAFSLWRFISQTVTVLLQVFILPGTNLKKFGAKKGAWAVVTGASDGIGKEFSFQLAKSGFNILLIARNTELLTATAREIQEKYPTITTAIHSIDFAIQDDAAYAKLNASFADKDIGVLVNNVGKSHSYPAYLVDTPKDEIDDILAINVGATVSVTYAILPGMVQRKRGLILNIGSFAGAIPSPMLAVYSGSKAFLATFSAALEEEVRGKNVLVQHVNTYFVVSKLSAIRRSSAMVPTPRAFVQSTLGKIGLSCGSAAGQMSSSTTNPYWSHALLEYVLTVLAVPQLAIKYTHWLHRDIRRRALRKKERLAKAAKSQ